MHRRPATTAACTTSRTISGTAVILQRMVFGNAGGVSGAGVGFTRDPALGERRLYMDFLLDAQGEDVVAGRQTVRRRRASWRRSPPTCSSEIEQVCSAAGGRVRRRAGVRADDPGGRAVPAADADRQAHAVGRAADRHRPGPRGLDLPRAPRCERLDWPRSRRRSRAARRRAPNGAERALPARSRRASASRPDRSRSTATPRSGSRAPARRRCWCGPDARPRTSQPSRSRREC